MMYVCPFQTVGFVWGYICQQFSQTILVLLAGFVLACLVCIFVVVLIIWSVLAHSCLAPLIWPWERRQVILGIVLHQS